MTHFELQELGKELGLEVATLRYRDENNRRDCLDIVFKTGARWVPNRGYISGDLICRFTMHYGMADHEYNEACAKAQNTLNQYKSWRPQA